MQDSHSVEEVNWLKLFPDNMVVVEIDSTGTLEKLPEVAVVSGEIIPVESKSIQIMELGQNSDVIDAANEPSSLNLSWYQSERAYCSTL